MQLNDPLREAALSLWYMAIVKTNENQKRLASFLYSKSSDFVHLLSSEIWWGSWMSALLTGSHTAGGSVHFSLVLVQLDLVNLIPPFPLLGSTSSRESTPAIVC